MPTTKKHLLTGQNGESLAVKFLEGKGYKIIEKNYRYKRSEIDIIATKGDILIFVEVKTRTSSVFGLPEASISGQKYSAIIKAADHYIHQRKWEKDIRFDVISILLEKSIEIHHIEDAFY